MDDITREHGLAALVRATRDDTEGVDTRVLASNLCQKLFGSSGSKAMRIGPYRVLERIGHGGMGVVYKAYDARLRRRVAIKLMATNISELFGARPLLREARAIAKLNHPNIVTVHDVGIHDSEFFVAMEYIDGEGLDRWQQKSRPWPEVIEVYRQAALGLASAHRAGIIHGDFKPQNALRDRDGRVCVLDFGLARAMRTGQTSAQEGSSGELSDPGAHAPRMVGGGTPYYMAPELDFGAKPTAASDQYALCVSMLGALGMTRERTIEAAFRDLRGVPLFLRRALKRGISPEPGARFESMADLVAAFDHDRSPHRRWLFALLVLAGLYALFFGWLHLNEL